MKRYLLLLSVLLLSITEGKAFSADTKPVIQLKDTAWKIGGFAGISLSQVALYQWAPGGTNNFAFLLSGNFFTKYKKNKLSWESNLDLKWGMVANGLIRNASLARKNLQKNIDLIQFNSNFGYQVTKSLYVATRLGFESQFTRSYDYTLTDTASGRFRRLTISRFGAPATLTLGPGMSWKPKPWFTLFFSPVQGKMTFVSTDHVKRDTATNADGSFTDNYYNDVDETRFGLKAGSSFMGELGAELDIMFQKDIVKNVNWKSRLNVFVTYLNKEYNTLIPTYNNDTQLPDFIVLSESSKHIPVIKWDNDIVFKINKFLSATLSTRFVYQYNAQLPVDREDNQTKEKGPDGVTDIWPDGTPKVKHNSLQIFQQLGIGLSYKF